MRTERSFSVDFKMRREKKDKTLASLFAKVTVDGEETEISLGEKILASEWDARSETVKGRGRDAKAVNEWINDVRFKIKESKRALETRNCRITCHAVKTYYEGKHRLQRPAEEGKTFQDLFNFHKEVEIDTGNLKAGTTKNHDATLRYMNNFLAAKFGNSAVELGEIDYQKVLELESFIRQNPLKKYDPCHENGLAKHMERLVIMFRIAEDIRWIDENPLINIP